MCVHYLTLKDLLDMRRHEVVHRINQIIPRLYKFNINITILLYCTEILKSQDYMIFFDL